ncbi:uncharacterized protein LOC129572847 [Sitodiplosis mosellana]|uniref:uncharacterized protein LOC129572847 n=1 Tax=Sitodiplosis mosellana TaxID=263140 RepID=UPI002443A387|nr:uncharacterized protein LOC129572847 [Sitodiplosis mosellana]
MARVDWKSFVLTVLIVLVGQTVAQTSDVVGKMSIGYQGWFATPFDGSPRKSWVHWTINAGNGSIPPSPGNCKFEVYPDMREYTQRYQTGLASLGNGQPANLFSSWDQSTVNIHFSWMQTYGIETVSFQRFGSDLKFPLARDQMNGVAGNVQRAAERYGRKVFIQYDLSNWANFSTELIPDLNTMTILTASPAYARHNGKRVICVWGMGFGEPGGNRPNNPTGSLNVINQLKSMGYYIIIGVPYTWRTNDGISLPAYAPVYRATNMIQPWSVGTFNSIPTALAYKSREQGDVQECNRLGIDYQPVIWPGFAWSNWNGPPRNAIPRLNGTFMWRQFMNCQESNITSVFVAMFDEYDEGTAIAKAAEDASMIPTNQYFLPLNADGGNLSSDFYLRLVGDGMKLLRKQITTSPNPPYTPPTPQRTSPNNPANNNRADRFQPFIDMMDQMTPSRLMSLFSTWLTMLGL